VIAFTGLGLVALSVGQRGPVAALGVALMAALSWAVGNILVKRAGPVQVLPLMAWASLVPPLPALAVASAGDAPGLLQAIARAPWESLAAVAYLGVAATTVAYGIWGSLLTRYPTSAVAPFTLLVPVVGVAAAAALLGERFGALRLIGMALIVAGVALSLINLQSPIVNRQSSIE
jgi:O-acetylserine/cysteine efflux transporter